MALNYPVLSVRIEPELERAIDDYRRRHDRIPPRADAIKELLRRGLAASQVEVKAPA